jgi:hypothetical protein
LEGWYSGKKAKPPDLSLILLAPLSPDQVRMPPDSTNTKRSTPAGGGPASEPGAIFTSAIEKWEPIILGVTTCAAEALDHPGRYSQKVSALSYWIDNACIATTF